ncbi:MAG: hypothetical protein JOZ51_17820 [Chloroflexi bacterium]|nr:hypothetical protein [Chloroflexota bacterium]
MFRSRRSVFATIGLLALLSTLLVQPIHSAPQRMFTSRITGDVLFTDDFRLSTISSDWNSSGWSIWAQEAWNSSGGYAPLQTAFSFSETGYVIETRGWGFGPTQGPSPGDSFDLVFGRANLAKSNYYRVVYFPYNSQLVLQRVYEIGAGPEFTTATLAQATVSLSATRAYIFRVVRNGASGLTQVYIDQATTPVLSATDTSYPALGHFGWIRESQAPSNFYVDWIEARKNTNRFNVEINFQPSSALLPDGYINNPRAEADLGAVYGNRGNGYTYGWNADNTANTRERNVAIDQRVDTLIRTQNGGNFTWEIAVPNAVYWVELYADDPSFTDSVYDLSLEGQRAYYRVPGAPQSIEGSATVQVTDGKLTLSNGPQGVNNKINWIRISELFSTKVNFQPSGTPLVTGYLPDYGKVYAPRGNGYTYGWNADNSANTRDRNTTTDQRYDTLVRMQNGGNFSWEIAVPEGQYDVRIVAGDPDFIDSVYKINVEYALAVNGTPTSTNKWLEGTATTVQVFASDGRLTISNASGAVNNKINFIEIKQTGIGR